MGGCASEELGSLCRSQKKARRGGRGEGEIGRIIARGGGMKSRLEGVFSPLFPNLPSQVHIYNLLELLLYRFNDVSLQYCLSLKHSRLIIVVHALKSSSQC